jgi:hypothetical protein
MDISDQIGPVKSPYKSKPRILYIGEGIKSHQSLALVPKRQRTNSYKATRTRRKVNKTFVA